MRLRIRHFQPKGFSRTAIVTSADLDFSVSVRKGPGWAASGEECAPLHFRLLNQCPEWFDVFRARA